MKNNIVTTNKNNKSTAYLLNKLCAVLLICILIYDNYWNTGLLNLKIIKILKDYNYAIKNKTKLNIKGYKKIRKTKYFMKY